MFRKAFGWLVINSLTKVLNNNQNILPYLETYDEIKEGRCPGDVHQVETEVNEAPEYYQLVTDHPEDNDKLKIDVDSGEHPDS